MLVCMFDKSEIDLMRSQQCTAIAGSKNDGTVASDDQIWQEKARAISVRPYCVEFRYTAICIIPSGLHL